MPNHLWIPDSVREFIRDLDGDKLRNTINLAIMSLVNDSIPPDARACRFDGEEIEYAYEIDVDLLTIFYTVTGDGVMIQVVDWQHP